MQFPNLQQSICDGQLQTMTIRYPLTRTFPGIKERSKTSSDAKYPLGEDTLTRRLGRGVKAWCKVPGKRRGICGRKFPDTDCAANHRLTVRS